MRILSWVILSLVAYAHGLPQRTNDDGIQIPFDQEPHVAVLPIKNIDYLFYTTTLGVGNPTQNYTAVIDIAWSDAWLPSVHCPKRSYEDDCAPHPLYNGSASSTYRGSGREIELRTGGFWTQGAQASDVYQLGPIGGINQSFEEASFVRPTWFFDDLHDTILPLARTTVPRHEWSNLSVPSVFQSLQAQGRLSRNVIGLRLPETDNATGEVRIGGISADIDPSGARLPIAHECQEPTPDSTVLTSGGWYVEPVSVTLESDPPVHFDLTGHIASLETALPFIIFPTAFIERMYDTLGSNAMDLPCADMHTLPNLTVALRGEGGVVHNFSLAGPDYLREQPTMPFTDEGICNLFATGLWDMPEDVPPFVMLGSLFLRKFYTVLDADEMMISRKFVFVPKT